MSRARRRNTDIVLVAHRVIAKGSLHRCVQAFLQLAIRQGHLCRQTTDHLQESSVSTKTPPTQESFLVTPPDQSPPL